MEEESRHMMQVELLTYFRVRECEELAKTRYTSSPLRETKMERRIITCENTQKLVIALAVMDTLKGKLSRILWTVYSQARKCSFREEVYICDDCCVTATLRTMFLKWLF